MTMTMLMKAGEVARRLGVSHTRVLQLTAGGQLPMTAKTADGWRLYDPADVEALARRRDARRALAGVSADDTGPRAA